MLLVSSVWAQVGVIASAALIGLLWLEPRPGAAHDPLPIAVGLRAGLPCLALFSVLLLAALYDPVWINAIEEPRDFGLALVALVALMFWKFPPWFVVMGSGLVASLQSLISSLSSISPS